MSYNVSDTVLVKLRYAPEPFFARVYAAGEVVPLERRLALEMERQGVVIVQPDDLHPEEQASR